MELEVFYTNNQIDDPLIKEQLLFDISNNAYHKS